MRETIADGVRTITFEREPMNTLDIEAVNTLSDLFQAHPRAVPLVLEGAGGVFSAGVDSRRFMAYGAHERLQMARAITRMTAHLLSIPAPVVAALGGHALGGGFVLALCCDHRVATESPSAKFGLFEAKAGIAFPAGPAHIVRSELPATLLRPLTLACRSFTSAELVKHAVFDELATADDLTALAQQRARELAALPGYGAVKAQMRGALADEVRRLAADGRESAFE